MESLNVTLWTDGGGRTRTAALRPIYGREAAARISMRTKRFWLENALFELKEVNGQAAWSAALTVEPGPSWLWMWSKGRFRRFTSLLTRKNSHGSEEKRERISRFLLRLSLAGVE